MGMRTKAYMQLLNVDTEMIIEVAENIEKCKVALIILDQGINLDDIIDNDINRSFSTFAMSKDLPEDQKDGLKKDMLEMISLFFSKFNGFTYYQGFNFMTEVFLLNYGKNIGYCFLEKLSLEYLQDYFNNETFTTKLDELLVKTYAILTSNFPQTVKKLRIENDEEDEALVSKLAFVISWFLCWFSYKIRDMDTVLRIFDYLLCGSKDTVAILSAVVVHSMFETSDITEDSPVNELISFTFSFPLDSLDWETMFKKAAELKKKESSIFAKSIGGIKSLIKKRPITRKLKESKTVRDVVSGVILGVGVISLLATAYARSKK